MIAGKLNESITLMRPVENRDFFGSIDKTYQDVKTVHAETDWKGGSTTYGQPEIVAGETLNFIIRDAHTVAVDWRVRYTGIVYHVNAINHNRQRGMKTLYCTKVNE